MNKPSPYIDRKEICVLLDYQVSERSICAHETEWGLDRVRVSFKTRPVLYHREKALRILQEIGMLTTS